MKITLKYALYITSISIIWKLMFYFSDTQQSWLGKNYIFGYFLFILVGILFGIKALIKHEEFDSSIGNKIKSGIKIAGLNALFFSIFIYCYYRWIDTSFFLEKINSDVSMLQMQKSSPENIDQYLKAAKTIYSPGSLFQATLLGFLTVGTIYSLICALVLQKKIIK